MLLSYPVHFLHRRSGIQLNASAFDSIPLRAAMQTNTTVNAITAITTGAGDNSNSIMSGMYGFNMQSGDNISPASATTTHSATSDEHSVYTDNNAHGANVRNSGEAPYSTISSRTLAQDEHIYTANYADNMVNYGANYDPSSPTNKDTSPGSIYPPPVSYDYNTTPYNYGVSGAGSGTNNSALSASTGLTDTPYMSTDYIMSYNGTPYRAKHSAEYSNSVQSSGTKITLEFEPESDEIVSSSVDSSFDCEVIFTSIYTGSPAILQNASATAANTTANGAISSDTGTNAVVHDVDTFVGENEHFKNNYLEQVNAPKSPDNGWAGPKRAAYLYTTDGGSESSTYTGIGANAEGVSNSGSPSSDPGTSSNGSGNSYTNGAGASGASGKKSSMFSTTMFELGADDALKLGEVSVNGRTYLCTCLFNCDRAALGHTKCAHDCGIEPLVQVTLSNSLCACLLSTLQMLYILRPLIYAVLVHQIDLHRQNRDGNSSNRSVTSSSTSSETIHTTTTTTGTTNALVTTGGINNTMARIAEYIAGASNSSGNATVSRVLDVVSVDALLSALALAVSFVSFLLSTCFCCVRL